jgi:thiamine-phosphate pyrophosphorylase
MINDRADVAAAAGADGVHLAGNVFCKLTVVRRSFGPDFLIGVSTTFDSDEVVDARQRDGADFTRVRSCLRNEFKEGIRTAVGS